MSSNPPILALDLATRTGACVGAGDVLPKLMHVDLPQTGEDGGRFFWSFRQWLLGVLDEHRPGLVVFEAPILPRRTSLTVTRKLQGLAAHVEEIAFNAEIDCREVSVQDVKTALVGHGAAKKADMVKIARAYGLEPHTYRKDGEEASDEADAFGAWLCAIRVRQPEHAHRWDLLTGRGLR